MHLFCRRDVDSRNVTNRVGLISRSSDAAGLKACVGIVKAFAIAPNPNRFASWRRRKCVPSETMLGRKSGAYLRLVPRGCLFSW